jgi:hypothetical protein
MNATTSDDVPGRLLRPGNTGARFFAADESGQMRQDTAQLPDMTAGIPLK